VASRFSRPGGLVGNEGLGNEGLGTRDLLRGMADPVTPYYACTDAHARSYCGQEGDQRSFYLVNMLQFYLPMDQTIAHSLCVAVKCWRERARERRGDDAANKPGLVGIFHSRMRLARRSPASPSSSTGNSSTPPNMPCPNLCILNVLPLQRRAKRARLKNRGFRYI
jgi:hypothetical protein